MITTAYVLINCELGQEQGIIDNLKHIDSVKEVHGTFGAYDVVARLENTEKEKIRETITWGIRKMENVRSILTLMDAKGQN